MVQAQATVFSRLKRRPWLAAACVVLSMIAMGYFTIIFPAERSAGKVKIALEKGFPGTRFVVGTAVAPDTLAHYIEVEVSFVVEERKQLEMREWLARWKFDHDLNFPVALRFRDPEYPYEKYPDHPRWLNQLVF